MGPGSPSDAEHLKCSSCNRTWYHGEYDQLRSLRLVDVENALFQSTPTLLTMAVYAQGSLIRQYLWSLEGYTIDWRCPIE